MNIGTNFQMKTERRDALLAKANESFLKMPITDILIIAVSIIVLGGGILVFGLSLPGQEAGQYEPEIFDMPWFYWGLRVLGVLILLLLPVTVYFRSKSKARTVARLAKHGGVNKAVAEIKEHLQKNLPAYTVNLSKNVNGKEQVSYQFDIVGKWLVQKGFLENILDIVAIVGISGRGTFLIFADGDKTSVSFGASNWGAVFALFKEANPHILYTDDALTLSDGRAANVRAAFEAKDFAAITAQYRR